MLTDVSGAEGLDFSVFETAVARHVSASGTPEFEYLLPVSAKDVYTVMVRAVGKGAYDSRMTGTFSNLENFTWSLRTLPLGNAVPWPARDLPPQAEFHPGISAVHLNISRLAPWRANAVRIGEYAETEQRDRLAALRASRDNVLVAERLDALRNAARGTENVVPRILDCARAYCTLYEIRAALEDVFGAYREPVFF